MKGQERKGRLDPPVCSFLHLSSHPSFSFSTSFSLMSVLSIGSQCESMAIIYTYPVTLYYAHIAISLLITDWFRRRLVVLSKALTLLVFTMW